MLPSRVLGLDLAVVGGRLRFYHAGSEILETQDILERVTARMDDLEIKAGEAIQRADLDAAARFEAEQRADLEAAARQDLERRLAELLARVGEG